MTIILDGQALADKITENIHNKTSGLTTKPTLAVIITGNNPASEIYVKNKQKKAEEIGFRSIVISLPEDVSEENLLEQIYILNEDEKINAVLVQLPLPKHLTPQRILEAIDPLKDVDGFTSYNIGAMFLGYKPFAISCTPKGIIRLIKEYNIEVEGKTALVIGRSNIVGKPVSILLQKLNATVMMAHSKTNNLKELAKNADIIVSAIGKPKYITKDYVKNGAVIIDVGINRTNEGIAGDVDFESVSSLCSYITPVPKGVGPMTIAMLMENTLELYMHQQNLIGNVNKY